MDRTQDRTREQEPITVVGAGPAGLSCAIALARSGKRVVLREWHGEIGHRFHGDFQGLENWSDERDALQELREAGIATTFDHHPVSEGIVFDSAGRRFLARSERPLFYLVRRGPYEGTLERALLQQAIEASVDVRFGDRLETVNSPAVLAIGPRVPDVIAAGYLFETDMPGGSWLALDNRLAPLGYSYLLVRGGRGTIATCMFTAFKRQAECVQRTVSFFQEHASLQMRNAKSFGGYGNIRLPRTAIQGGHLIVGEQAGFQDALAGFGIRYALRSGLLAARSIIESLDYTSLWREHLRPLLRAGVVNRFIVNTLGDRGTRRAAERLGQRDAGLTLRHFYQASLMSRLLFPLAHCLYRLPLRDRSCDHIGCGCVWCEHGGEASAPC